MIKITLIALFSILAISYVAETKITLYPFRVSFARPWLAIGWAFVTIGVGLIQYQARRDGAKDAINIVKEEIKKEI